MLAGEAHEDTRARRTMGKRERREGGERKHEEDLEGGWEDEKRRDKDE